jgi:hypothetical protein
VTRHWIRIDTLVRCVCGARGTWEEVLHADEIGRGIRRRVKCNDHVPEGDVREEEETMGVPTPSQIIEQLTGGLRAEVELGKARAAEQQRLLNEMVPALAQILSTPREPEDQARQVTQFLGFVYTVEKRRLF